MFLLSDLRADEPRRRVSGAWNVALVGALLVGFALMAGQSMLDSRTDNGHHSLNVGRNILSDPSAITIKPLPGDVHGSSFALNAGVGSDICHYLQGPESAASRDAPATCDGN